MYWAEKGSRGLGQWFEGTVLGTVERSKGDPCSGSPWASVSVLWGDSHTDGDGYENHISPWELTSAKEDPRFTFNLGGPIDTRLGFYSALHHHSMQRDNALPIILLRHTTFCTCGGADISKTCHL